MIEQSLFDTFFKTAPFLASFLGGILTFLSPCILPLLPAYISYISGLSLEEIKTQNYSNPIRILLSCLMFIFGFSIVFILLNLFIHTFLATLFSHPIARYLAGGIICLFGLHLMGVLKFSFLYRTKRFDFKGGNLFAPFLLGISFSLGWSPCVGPILAGIFTLSAIRPQDSFLLIIVFCLGLAIPFLITSLFISFSLKFMKKMTKYLRVIEIVSGLLLIGIGIAITTQQVGVLTDWIS